MPVYTSQIPQASFCPYCMSKVQPGETCKNCGLRQGSYAASPHHIPPGTILLDRYLVGRVLGEGGFGITYIGCDLRLEAKVAIKEYFPVDQVSRYADSSLTVVTRAGRTQNNYTQGIERFLKEARSLARMEKQTAVVTAKDFFEANNTAYIVMEYIQGTDLKTLVTQRGGRISAQELLPMIEPLFAALDAVHQTGLIHRDISPDNIMLEKGKVRLLDFGCARESIKGTETMTVALKQGYAPVEQYQRKGQGPWTDVYALAAVIYFCLTGKVPPASLDRILEDELVPPRQLGANILPEQEAALMKALSISGRGRYQSVATFYEALYHPAPPQPAVEAVPAEPPAVKPEPEAEPAPAPAPRPWTLRGKTAALAAGAVAAVGLIALLIGLAAGGREPGPTDPAGTAQGGQSQTDGPTDPGNTPAPAGNVSVSTTGEFQAALENSGVTSITLAPGSTVDLQDQYFLELRKPLYIPENARFNMAGQLVVGQGGYLELASGGYLYVEGGILRTAQGGSVAVKDGGIVDVFRIVVEQDADLRIDDGGTAQLLGSTVSRKADLDKTENYITLPGDALFDGGTRVTTEAELLQAANSRAASITVAAGSSLRLEKPLTLKTPLLIEEGATLSLAADVTLEISDTLLVNRGTLTNAAVQGRRYLLGTGEFRIFNFGTMNVSLECLDDPPGRFMNLGEINCYAASVRHQFDNLGTVRFQGGTFAFLGGVMNCGSWELVDSPKDFCVDIFHFDNAGSITLGANTQLYNYGVFNSYGGSITSAGKNARLMNDGIMNCESERTRISLLHENAQLQGLGLLHYSEGNLSLFGGLEAANCHTICYDWAHNTYTGDGTDHSAVARAFSGSQWAFFDCDLHLTGDWTITAPVVVWGELTVDGNLTVADGGYLSTNHLRADSLTMTKGSTARVGDSVDIPGGVYLEDSALYCNAAGQIQTALRLQRSNMVLCNNMDVINAAVSLEACNLRIAGNFKWINCDSITVDQASTISLCANFTMEGGQLTNHGRIYANLWDWLSHVDLYGTIDNYGTMNFNTEGHLTMGGTLRNYGELHTRYWEAGGLIVTGRLENSGDHYHSVQGSMSIVTQGGKVSGADPIFQNPGA